MCKQRTKNMLINNNTNYVNRNVSFGKLIPINKYSGPVLKLTKDDTEKINALQENITRLEVDLYKFKRYFEYKRVIPQNWEYYSEKIDIIYNQIDRLREAIKEIKINRLNIQKCLEK